MAFPTSTGQSFALLDAMQAGQLALEYQPIFDLVERRCVGVEALVRWDHPTRGRILPGEFLHLTSHRGIADRLTGVVICKALAQHRAWKDEGHVVPVSINIGPDGFVGPESVDLIEAALAQYGVDPQLLTVEVTEEEADLLSDDITARLVGLSSLGVRLSLDDFGTGHASLSRLKRWHFDEVKIDRSFIANVCGDPTDREIVIFSVSLAHALHMAVVAEGVSDERAVALLATVGVDSGQGFYLGRPARPEGLDLSALGLR